MMTPGLGWTLVEDDSGNQVTQAPVDAESRMEDPQSKKHSLPGSSDDDVIIFRITHTHPHLLKRPLKHTDDIKSLDFALRIYAMASPDGDCVKVHRADSSDIQVMELVTSTAVEATHLIQHMKQWTVKPGIILEPGEGFGARRRSLSNCFTVSLL